MCVRASVVQYRLGNSERNSRRRVVSKMESRNWWWWKADATQSIAHSPSHADALKIEFFPGEDNSIRMHLIALPLDGIFNQPYWRVLAWPERTQRSAAIKPKPSNSNEKKYPIQLNANNTRKKFSSFAAAALCDIYIRTNTIVSTFYRETFLLRLHTLHISHYSVFYYIFFVSFRFFSISSFARVLSPAYFAHEITKKEKKKKSENGSRAHSYKRLSVHTMPSHFPYIKSARQRKAEKIRKREKNIIKRKMSFEQQAQRNGRALELRFYRRFFFLVYIFSSTRSCVGLSLLSRVTARRLRNTHTKIK